MQTGDRAVQNRQRALSGHRFAVDGLALSAVDPHMRATLRSDRNREQLLR